MDNPLVSIVVVTYNSSQFILETLESCKAQTFKNLELVITDDASNDNTVAICRKWLNENGHNFIFFKLLESENNTGLTSNVNRGLLACRGDWVKLCAGDDILAENSIATYLNHINLPSNSNCSVYFLPIKKFSWIGDQKSFSSDEGKYELFLNSKIDAQQQRILYLHHVQIPPITGLLFKKSLLLHLGLCDERFPFHEDYPLIMKILTGGFKIYGANKPAVYYYRVHDKSLYRNQRENYYVTDWMFSSYLPVAKEYIIKNLTFLERLIYLYQFVLYKMVYKSSINLKSNKMGKIFFVFDYPVQIGRSFFRSYYIRKIKKQLNK